MNEIKYQSQREQEVWRACDSLYEEGFKVREITGKAVAERLVELDYKEGNPNYRYKYINSWLQHHGLNKQAPLEQLVERKPSDVIARGAELFRKSIEKTVREEYEAKFQEAQKQADQFKAQCKQAQEELVQQKEVHNNLKQEFNNAKEENKQLLLQISQLNREKGRLETQCLNLEKSYQALRFDIDKNHEEYKKRSEETLKGLKEELLETRNLHRQEIKEMRKIMEEQRQGNVVEISNLKAQNQKLDNQLGKLEIEKQNLTSDKKEIQFQQQRLEKVIDDLETDNKGYINKAYEAEKQLATTKAELKQIQLMAKDSQQQLKQAQQKLFEHKERVGRLEEKLDQARLKIKSGNNKPKNR